MGGGGGKRSGVVGRRTRTQNGSTVAWERGEGGERKGADGEPLGLVKGTV